MNVLLFTLTHISLRAFISRSLKKHKKCIAFVHSTILLGKRMSVRSNFLSYYHINFRLIKKNVIKYFTDKINQFFLEFSIPVLYTVSIKIMSNAQKLWFKQQLTCIPWSLHSLSLFSFFCCKQSHAVRVSVEKLLSYKILWWPTNAFNLSAWNKPSYRNLSFGCEVVNHESRWMGKVKKLLHH